MENSAKILLLGKTGVGKSSFINYFLGKTVAKAAVGLPVTLDNFIQYEIEGGRYPIEIFDTKGLEALGANDQLQEIINGIKKRNNSDDIFDWFHTIFYCVSMSNPRFEDFEANFIRRLQQELTQHIHIILTHCDSAKPEIIANMRHTITSCLDDAENIEIFEVVCVSKKKRNGQVVEPRGREEVSERVFDLLVEDIAHRMSVQYANTLRPALKKTVNRIFSDVDNLIDETIKLKNLFHVIREDEGAGRIEQRMDETLGRLDEEIERIEKRINARFAEILRPMQTLYTSYQSVVTNSFVKSAELAFDLPDWLAGSLLDGLDDDTLMKKAFPKIGKYMDTGGDIPDPDNIFSMLGMIGDGVHDLFTLKKNLKKVTAEMRSTVYRSIPSQKQIQAKAYDRIVAYMKR